MLQRPGTFPRAQQALSKHPPNGSRMKGPVDSLIQSSPLSSGLSFYRDLGQANVQTSQQSTRGHVLFDSAQASRMSVPLNSLCSQLLPCVLICTPVHSFLCQKPALLHNFSSVVHSFPIRISLTLSVSPIYSFSLGNMSCCLHSGYLMQM